MKNPLLLSTTFILTSFLTFFISQPVYTGEKEDFDKLVLLKKTNDSYIDNNTPYLSEYYTYIYKNSFIVSSDDVTIYKTIERTAYTSVNPNYTGILPEYPVTAEEKKRIASNIPNDHWSDVRIRGIDCNSKEFVLNHRHSATWGSKRLALQRNESGSKIYKLACQSSSHLKSPLTSEELLNETALGSISLKCIENENRIIHYIYLNRGVHHGGAYYTNDPISKGIIHSLRAYKTNTMDGWPTDLKSRYDPNGKSNRSFWNYNKPREMTLMSYPTTTKSEWMKKHYKGNEYIFPNDIVNYWKIFLDLKRSKITLGYYTTDINLVVDKKHQLKGRKANIRCIKIDKTLPEFSKIKYIGDYMRINALYPENLPTEYNIKLISSPEVKSKSGKKTNVLCKNAADYEGCMRYQESK